jgi:hypothetical protein
LGKYQKAKGLHLQVLEAKKRVLGPEHVHTLTSMNNLALAYRALGKYQPAKAILRDVVEKQKFILGDQHPITLQSIQQLSNLHHRLNESKFHKIGISSRNINF